MAPRRPEVLGVLACGALLALVLVPTLPQVRAEVPTILQTGEKYCNSSPCQDSLGVVEPGGDNLIVGIGLRCSPSCSSVRFSDALGTSFTVLSASTTITCPSASGTVSVFLAYGVTPRSGEDTVFVRWSGTSPLKYGSVFDVMEANDALYLVSGTSTGISGTPSLGGSLSATQGDIFVEFLASTYAPYAPGGRGNDCDQNAGSSAGWTNWGGVYQDRGLYNTGISSSNFPYPPFTDSRTDWVEIGAIFGASPGLTSTSLTCSPGSLAVGTSTKCLATVADDSALPSSPTGMVSFSSDSGNFSPSASCTLVPASSSTSACSMSYVPNPGTEGGQEITGTYSGDSGHPGSVGTASVSATQRGAKITVTCSPRSLTGSESTTCTATVVDTSPGIVATPTGTVSWENSGSGTFNSLNCVLAGSKATATCAVVFTPAPTGQSVQRIIGTYGGDKDHITSTGSELVEHT